MRLKKGYFWGLGVWGVSRGDVKKRGKTLSSGLFEDSEKGAHKPGGLVSGIGGVE